jgi:hypothetical protein
MDDPRENDLLTPKQRRALLDLTIIRAAMDVVDADLEAMESGCPCPGPASGDSRESKRNLVYKLDNAYDAAIGQVLKEFGL